MKTQIYKLITDPDGSFPCEYCDERFIDDGNWWKHMRSAHRVEYEEIAEPDDDR